MSKPLKPYFVTLSINGGYSSSIIAPTKKEAKLKMLKEILEHDKTLRMLADLYPSLSQKLLRNMTAENRAPCKELSYILKVMKNS